MDLVELQEIAEEELAARKAIRLRVCTAAGCLSSNAHEVQRRLEDSVEQHGLGAKVQICPVGCMRLCCEGPLVQVDPEGSLYERVTPDQAASIVGGLAGGRVTARRGDEKRPFFARQKSIVLEHSGLIEPERIESYIAAGGYHPLYEVVREMNPAEVIDAVTRSGLRGRGGAGYPTGLKWGMVAKSQGQHKYVVCNADEGDPGAFMDRSVLESDPHRVLEGMAIAAYAVGAEQGYIYVRGEYPLAIHRLETGIRQARRLGLLGTQIFESPFNFRVDLRIGAGAFVCGEETALIASIEGRRGTPRPRPPYPAASGLWGDPTLINNVETFANIPADHPQRCGLVRLDRHREEQGDEGLRPGRQDPPHRPGRGADGDDAPGDRRGDRRRSPRRRQDQGRPDRRPLGRLHPRRRAGHPGRL